jgi:hypothetical protein
MRAASNMLALYPDFSYAHFQMAMVHVARGHLADAETVLRQGAAVQDRQLGRGGWYPALGLHRMLGLLGLAQHDPRRSRAGGQERRTGMQIRGERDQGKRCLQNGWHLRITQGNRTDADLNGNRR